MLFLQPLGGLGDPFADPSLRHVHRGRADLSLRTISRTGFFCRTCRRTCSRAIVNRLRVHSLSQISLNKSSKSLGSPGKFPSFFGYFFFLVLEGPKNSFELPSSLMSVLCLSNLTNFLELLFEKEAVFAVLLSVLAFICGFKNWKKKLSY